MAPKKVKEETEDQIVLVDSAMGNTLKGLFEIAFGLAGWYIFFHFFVGHFFVGWFGGRLFLFWVGLLFALAGAFFIWHGLRTSLIKKSVIIDKRLQDVVIKEDSSIKYLKSIEKISFSHIKEVGMIYQSSSVGDDYDSPITDSYTRWKISLITIDEDPVRIYDGDHYSKSKVEKIAEKICRITDANVTYRTLYDPVEEETDNRIVLANNIDCGPADVLVSLVIILFGSFAVWCGFLMWSDFFPFPDPSFFLGSYLMLFIRFGVLIGALFFGGIYIWIGLAMLLIKESVTIDKRLQNVTVKKDSFIKYLRSIKEIPFSHIKKIEITYNTHSDKHDYDSSANDSSGSWSISLIAIDGDPVEICGRRPKSTVEKIAEKVCRITDANVTHRTHYTPPSYCDPELR